MPQSGDVPAQSQAQILANFQQLNTIFANNHIAFNAAINNGKHTTIEMLEQALPASAAGEGVLYAFNSGGTREQLRYRRESNGTVIPISEWFGAFCNFTAANPAVVNKQFNIASVTWVDNTTYDVLFTDAMTDANYIVVFGRTNTSGSSNIAVDSTGVPPTVNGFRVISSAVFTYKIMFAVFGEIA